MRKTLYTLVSAMSIGLVSCNDNYSANKVLEALQQGSPSALIDNKSIDGKIEEGNKGTKADNLEKRVEGKKEEVKTVEKEKEAKEQQKIEYRVYSKEELASIDQKVAEYKKIFETAGYRDEALKWLNHAIDEARGGGDCAIEYLRIARKKYGYVEDALCNPGGMIREVYLNLIKIEGPKHTREWLKKAEERAKSGEVWNEVESSIRRAEGYARESGIEVSNEIENIREAYKRGIKEYGPKNAAQWLRTAAERLEKCGSLTDIQRAIRFAREYAKEAGFELVEKQ